MEEPFYSELIRVEDDPMFLYFAPNAVHFPMQGKEEIRDPIVTELTSNLEKPAKLDAFSIADIVEIIEELRLVLKFLSGKDFTVKSS